MRKISFWFLTLLILLISFRTQISAAETVKDGSYEVEVSLDGGTGRASVTSPCKLEVQDGKITAYIEWSSSHYDYMIIDGEKYLPVNTEGNSVFEIPVTVFDEGISVIADTTAMSTPHEIEYTLTFDSKGLSGGDSFVKWILLLLALLILFLFILLFYKKRKTLFSLLILSCLVTGSLSACGQTDHESASADPTAISSQLIYKDSMELSYADQFSVDYYEDDYALITVHSTEEDRYLLVPEGKKAPEDLPEDITVLSKPLNHIYLVASAVMDMFASFDGIENLTFTGTKEQDWYIEEAKTAMEAGTLRYAGKYSAPDYEMILSGDCNLAIENTMIYHTPEVKEQLEKFDIPVLVDNSSYEQNPLGRTEWVKLYGLLCDKETEAEEVFKEQENAFLEIEEQEASGKTVAFFYITSDGQANVRKSNDYLAKMIRMAGGEYIFKDLGNEEESANSTVSMTMEEFYESAVDADYIIYNSTIEGNLSSVDELLMQSELLKNFEAVKKGNVYCTSKNLYQSSMELGTIISDIYHMLQGEDEELTYIYHID